MAPPRIRASRAPVLVLVAIALASVAAGCSPSADAPARELRVAAAASLTDAFTELSAEFEQTRPDVTVTLILAGSATLREQILAGAPVDVFAAANDEVMDEIVAAALTDEVVAFARNRLQIAVPPGNPAGITGLDDFADPSRFVGVCAPQVPCGALADAVLSTAGVEASVDTEEPNVRALLAKVASGELDAGLVYRSDVTAADGTVDGIDLPSAPNASATYPIATLRNAAERMLADEFRELVLSPEGQAVLRRWGFESP